MSVRTLTIPRFPGGKRIAVTFSFDDGPDCDRRIVEAFNNWGLRATFNLNSSRLAWAPSVRRDETDPVDAASVRSLYEGHEVAAHTVTHPDLTQLRPDAIVSEVWDDRRALEDLVGYPVCGFAYPFGTYNDQVTSVLRALGVKYARTTWSVDHPFPAADPLEWATTGHQYDETNGDVPTRFMRLMDNPNASTAFAIWGHSWEFAKKADWAGLERLFKPLSGHTNIWYCTNIELFAYEEARNRLVVGANLRTAYNPSAITVSLLHNGHLVAVKPGETFVASD